MRPDRDTPAAPSAPLPAPRTRPSARRRRRRLSVDSELTEFDPIAILSILPIVVFWVVRRFAETEIAIGAGFGTSLIVFTLARRRGVIGLLALLGLIVVGGASVVGIILDSDKAYLASDPIGDFIIALVFLGSVVVRRPLLGVIVRELFPRLATVINEQHRVFYLLSLAWAVQNVATGVVRIFLLQELSTDGYILWSWVVSWPVGIALLLISAYFIGRAVQNEQLALEPVEERA